MLNKKPLDGIVHPRTSLFVHYVLNKTHLKYICIPKHYQIVRHSNAERWWPFASAAGQLSPHRREVFCEGLFLVLKLSPHMGAQTRVHRHQARYITRSGRVQLTCRVRSSCRAGGGELALAPDRSPDVIGPRASAAHAPRLPHALHHLAIVTPHRYTLLSSLVLFSNLRNIKRIKRVSRMTSRIRDG